ncbi:MAG: rhamnogalacturonan acetylesterase [Prosthecobacter sp.]
MTYRAFLSLLLLVPSFATADVPPPRPMAKKIVALAGDSTVTDAAGWGAAFAKLLNPATAECKNFAGGGQSTKSFRDSKKWQQVLDAKPNVVLIQFGHNDMPGKGPHRETDPATTYPENLGRYIDEARAIGAEPIIVTSLTRRLFLEGKIRGELKPYAEAAIKVATEKKVPLVDLFARSVALHEKMGEKESDSFNPPGKKKDNSDRTHLNAHGAQVVAGIIAEELRKVAPEVAKLLK